MCPCEVDLCDVEAIVGPRRRQTCAWLWGRSRALCLSLARGASWSQCVGATRFFKIGSGISVKDLNSLGLLGLLGLLAILPALGQSSSTSPSVA